jgi:hypothetical protein
MNCVRIGGYSNELTIEGYDHEPVGKETFKEKTCLLAGRVKINLFLGQVGII